MNRDDKHRLITAAVWLVIMFGILAQMGCASKTPDTVVAVAAEPTPSPTPSPWVQSPPSPAEFPYGAPVDGPLPNVLMVGDSITHMYTGYLYDILKGSYDVHTTNDNCRNSFYTLANFEKWTWANDGIIVWNNGVWDDAELWWHDQYVPLEPVENYWVSDADYEANIIAIARKMKATGARVLFMTTTDLQKTVGGGFRVGREITLNEIAKRVLPGEGVEVYDLYDFGLAIPNSHPNQWEVHFTTDANKLLAWYVAQAIRGKVSPYVP